jgi:hypothetical protein
MDVKVVQMKLIHLKVGKKKEEKMTKIKKKKNKKK